MSIFRSKKQIFSVPFRYLHKLFCHMQSYIYTSYWYTQTSTHLVVLCVVCSVCVDNSQIDICTFLEQIFLSNYGWRVVSSDLDLMSLQMSLFRGKESE